jgi:hypothetical protein
MIAQTLLNTATKRLKRLSLDRLKVADDFLAYLEEREENEASQELLALPGFAQTFDRAVQQARAGEVTPFDNIRRNV